jgi:hypothetical protein
MAQRRDVIAELQSWYLAHANGDWEHQHGITIETLDNPGWSLRIDLTDTELVDHPLDRHEQHRTKNDWLVVWRDATAFQATCGPLNLGQVINLFLDWAAPPA